MKLEAPKNPNYCATVVRVRKLVPLEKCDNIVGMPMFGLQAIVGVNTKEGDLGILFPAEVQLSNAFVTKCNLYRHAEQNADPTVKGFIEDNRRVRTIKLRGHRSDALFMPITCLNAFIPGADVEKLREGDQFDFLNDTEICRKYVRKVREARAGKNMLPREKRVDEKVFPQHFDSMQWARVDRTFPDNTEVIITQKIHGTSIRVGNVPVARKFSWLDKLAARLGVKVQTTEFSMVYGSRKVVKDANNPLQQHFYDTDLWTSEGKKLDGVIPENYIVYGELIGWVPNSVSPIQEHYTYDCPPGTCKLFIYRVSHVNAQGTVADLSWDALVDFCESTGLVPVPFLVRCTVGRLNDVQMHTGRFIDTFLDTNLRKDGYFNAVPLADDSPCDEGVCIRIEGMIPSIFKHKSPMFLQHETKMLDKDVVDIDADESAPEAAEEDLLA